MPTSDGSQALCTIFLRLCYDPAVDELGLFTEWLWAVTAIVQALLLCLLVARRNASNYPAFSAYIVMTLAQSGLLFVAIKGWGFSSSVSWRIRWLRGSWCWELARLPSLNSAAVYLRIIPEVNWRLRSLDEQLIQFWRLEAPRT
jgi:hypothetical protein